MTAGDDESELPPISGSDHRRKEDWGGSIMLMTGFALTAVALVVRDQLWLWILGPAVVVAGIVLWAVAGPGAASRRRRRGQPDGTA